MAGEFSEKAKEALIDDEFQAAVDLFDKAIDLDSTDANLFADRAQAHIKLHNFTEAVSDSIKAIQLNPSLVKAYLRKGSACIKLEEYRTAKAALETGASLSPNDSRFSRLIEECNKNIAEDQEKLQTPIVPQVAEPAPVASHPSNTITESIKGTENGGCSSHDVDAVEVVKPKYRHDFYEHPGEGVVSILAKGKAEGDVVLEFGEQILSVSINEPGEDAYHFQPRLFGKIIPEKCSYKIWPSKIEIRLAKAESINWKSLEYSKEAAVPQKINDLSVVSHRPLYPSSKNREADWDKLEAQVKKEEKEEKLDGDAALNKFFREIYQDADEDTRRAMTKSFVESNGTVLSTNWKDVGSKKVEGSPPDGMELKKW